MEKHIVYDAALTKADRLVLKALAVDVETHQEAGKDKTDRRGIPDAKEERDNVQPCKWSSSPLERSMNNQS